MMCCRHPGQYFLTGGESQDFLVNNDVSGGENEISRVVKLFLKVCNTEVTPEEMKLGVARGGAVSLPYISPFLHLNQNDAKE